MPKRPSIRSAAVVEPRVRRAYFECRFGQLHVRHSLPPGGGFDEGTPLLCLHQSPMSGRTFDAFIRRFGVDRSVYAPDTPGYGESDAPPSPPTVLDYAEAIGDFIDGMRFRTIDVLGYHTGAAIATELALARPAQVRRLVLVGVPILTAEERAAFEREPWPVAVREDGSHVATEWQRTVRWRGPGMTLEMMQASFAEKLRAGSRAAWGARAVMAWPARERLAAVRQPILVLRPRDDLWEATARITEVAKAARLTDLPEYGFGLFDVAPEAVATAIGGFVAS
jgi:pimeloyl-ACP methyl ester carboxylesterase